MSSLRERLQVILLKIKVFILSKIPCSGLSVDNGFRGY